MSEADAADSRATPRSGAEFCDVVARSLLSAIDSGRLPITAWTVNGPIFNTDMHGRVTYFSTELPSGTEVRLRHIASARERDGGYAAYEVLVMRDGAVLGESTTTTAAKTLIDRVVAMQVARVQALRAEVEREL